MIAIQTRKSAGQRFRSLVGPPLWSAERRVGARRPRRRRRRDGCCVAGLIGKRKHAREQLTRGVQNEGHDSRAESVHTHEAVLSGELKDCEPRTLARAQPAFPSFGSSGRVFAGCPALAPFSRGRAPRARVRNLSAAFLPRTSRHSESIALLWSYSVGTKCCRKTRHSG